MAGSVLAMSRSIATETDVDRAGLLAFCCDRWGPRPAGLR